ncbi:MAG: 50S ribosomal protein L25 [Planctomycetia bacterium]|nr:50S ribosomal protein L25 [Planctomycetia bacterium]
MSDTLEVVPRQATGSRESRRLRGKGLVPAILYGHGEKCVELAAAREALEAVVRHGGRIVDLKGAVREKALIRELQWDTYGVRPLHVDLLRVSKTDRIKVKVPIDLKGEAPGHRSGGVVTLLVHEIEIECTPDTIPERIHAQIGGLELGGMVKAHDLELPPGARVTHAGDETIVTCVLPAKKGEEPAAAAAAAEPELIGRKPAEEGEGEAAEG